tara:strand:+ start:519 stop:1232 length:714 start_codon:yes stop_codon:yes gene_type:complete
MEAYNVNITLVKCNHCNKETRNNTGKCIWCNKELDTNLESIGNKFKNVEKKNNLMKKLLLILLCLPLIGWGQKNIKLLDIVDVVQSSNIDTKIKNTFNGRVSEQKEIYIPPYNLVSKVYQVDDFKISNGICDAMSVYSYKGDFVQLEIGFQSITGSLNELKRLNGLEFITSGEFHNGKFMCVNYLFKYYGYAINVVTLKESQKVGSFSVSSDDIFFLSLTTIKYYNITMSENYGVKL